MTQSSDQAIGHWSAEQLPTLDVIRARLGRIFPPGSTARSWAIAERAARSVYVFLYAFAVEGVSNNRVRPAMVTTMSDAQAAITGPAERQTWWDRARRPRRPGEAIEGRWYAENTREPIRDETFRAWAQHGALLEDQIPTTSAAPRYRLARDFADLFNPALDGSSLDDAIDQWQRSHLTPSARARTALIRRHATAAAGVAVRFPDGTSRILAMGPSTGLAQATVEEFSARFLRRPIVLAVTESRQRLAYEDAAMLSTVGLEPDPRIMPDILLADVDGPGGRLRLVFLELVATGGPMSAQRIGDIRSWLAQNGLEGTNAAFGTVFADRDDPAFHRYVSDLAWGTFAWCASEPNNLMVLFEGGRFTPQATLDQVTD